MTSIPNSFQSAKEREEFLFAYNLAKQNQRDNNIDLEEGWDICLRCGINVVGKTLLDGNVSKPFGNRGYVALYSIGFGMGASRTQGDNSAEIYSRVKQALDDFLTDKVVEPLLDTNLVGISMIKIFSTSWDNHKIMTKWVQKLFCHLDRGYVANSEGSEVTLVACSMMKFLEVGFGRTFERVRDGVLKLIDDERNGIQVDREQLRSCVEVFIVMGVCQSQLCKDVKDLKELLNMQQDLSIYEMNFEIQFIENSRSYYKAHCALWREASVPEYLLKCEQAIRAEKERVGHYLSRSTEEKLLLCVEQELLSNPQIEIVQRTNSGMYALLVDAKFEKPWSDMTAGEREHSKSAHLRRMFQLFTRKGVKLKEGPMTEVFEQFVKDSGRKLVAERKDEVAREVASEKKKEDTKKTSMIICMIDLYLRCEALVKELFNNTLSFQKAMKEAFQVFVNENASENYTNVEMLVEYSDMVMKGKEGKEKLHDTAIQQRIEGLMRIFSFLADKDIFIECYRASLSKRLLSSKMSNEDMEKELLTKLKAEQGPPFTSKVEGMLKDFAMCKNNTDEFTKILSERQDGGFWQTSNGPIPAKPLEFGANVQVLTDGFWPTQTVINVQPRGPFATIVQQYEAFYHEKHKGKKRLNWRFALGSAQLRGIFPKGNYQIRCVTLQAMALLLLSDKSESLSTSDIAQEMGSTIDVIKRVLHSLSCGKYKVLLKTPSSKTVSEDDKFEANEKFYSKVRNFEIVMASLNNLKQGAKEKAKEDRSYAIDAALVRTMKARKRMAHKDLISEVLRQLQTFTPESKYVKKRIESLIEREYIRRVDETKEYEYLA